MLHYKMEVTAKMKEGHETLMVYCYCQNDIGLCDTSSIASGILCYQLIPRR